MKPAVLACTGLDKTEGSIAREVAVRLAEEDGAEIVCPVVLNRTPARYREIVETGSLVTIDGCATKCATKLASVAGAKIEHRVVVTDTAKSAGLSPEPGLRLGAIAQALVERILEDVRGVAAEPAQDPPGPDDAGERFESPVDHAVVSYDKYEFRIPLAGYLFNANDVWVQISGDRARVGISDYMQQKLTEITYVDPPAVGSVVEQFDDVGTVESTKATFEIVSPVGGTVVAVNEQVVDVPESINEDPYGAWIVELELQNWQEDQVLLIDGRAYAADVERKAAEE